jgi:xanthine dehydrogenase accessory factor
MIEKKILKTLQQGETLALVTIIDKSGSAPRLPGSKMFVTASGTLHGTIGGGRLEYSAYEQAKEVALGAKPLVTEFDMRGSGMDGDADMVCGGIQIVLIERLTPEMTPMFERALACFAGGAYGAWIINVSDSESPERSFADLQAGNEMFEKIDFAPIMRGRTTRLIQLDNQRIVVDPLPKSGTVVLFGGGHVSREVADLAASLDFEVIVCDDRQEFASKQRFPMVKAVHVVDFTRAFSPIDQTEELYLLIITRGHSFDQEVLSQSLQTRARYIGMIGSRRKRDIIYDNLRNQGFADADFARVHCPVGLAIGSETPREIAVSIIAELIAARAGVL